MGSRVPSGTGWWDRRRRYPRAFLRWMDVRQSRDVFGASRGGLNGSHEAAFAARTDLGKKLRCRRCASRRVFYSRPMTTAACAGWTSRPSAWCVRTVVSTQLRHPSSIHRVDIARVTSRRELRSVFGREASVIFISQRKVPPTNSCAQLCWSNNHITRSRCRRRRTRRQCTHANAPCLTLTHIRARHAVRSCTRALGPRGTPADPSPWTCSRRTWAIAGECSAGQPP